MKPVLWYHPVSQRVRYDGAGLGRSWIPLYRKHEWVELTAEEINAMYVQHHNQFGECISGDWGYERDLEARLKEKNNAG